MIRGKTSWLEWSALAMFGACALAVACDVSSKPMDMQAVLGPPRHGDGAFPFNAVSGRASIAGGGAGVRAVPPLHSDGSFPVQGPCDRVFGTPAVASGGSDDRDAGAEDDADGGTPISCRSTPNHARPADTIECQKQPGTKTWTCQCPSNGCMATCTTQAEQPCGYWNCCGVEPDRCPVQTVDAAPSDSCQSEVSDGTMTACGLVAPGGTATVSTCCPPTKPFACPSGGCFATEDEAAAVCPGTCSECAAAPRTDAVGLGQLCGRASDPPCPTGSDCIVRPPLAPGAVGFCSPLCSAFSTSTHCPWASAPPGIRTRCAGPGEGYLSDHCYLINEGCNVSCPTGFNCQTGGCFPD